MIRRLLAVCAVACLAWPGRCADWSSVPTKGRRRVDTWLVYSKEPGFERIERLADIINSISVAGDPPASWVDRCHKLGIEVYFIAGGAPAAFDTPEHARRTIDGYLEACRRKGYDGIDLDFELLDPKWQGRYSEFLKEASARLHLAGKKLSHCVSLYDGMLDTPPAKQFYDPAVVAKTCDVIRVMCYDLYFAPDRGDPKRKDPSGFGPTSTVPWARTAMQFWLRFASQKQLVMGLPAYSNDYPMTPAGRGAQVYAPEPQAAANGAPLERAWLSYEQLNAYLYRHKDGAMHLFYASDEESTKAQLATASELGISGIGFWHFSSVGDKTWDAVRAWLKLAPNRQ